MFPGIGEGVAAIERPANQSHTLGILCTGNDDIFSHKQIRNYAKNQCDVYELMYTN